MEGNNLSMHAWQYLAVSIMMNSSLHGQGVDRPAIGEEMVLLHPSGVPTGLSDSHTCVQIAALRGSPSTFRDISTIE